MASGADEEWSSKRALEDAEKAYDALRMPASCSSPISTSTIRQQIIGASVAGAAVAVPSRSDTLLGTAELLQKHVSNIYTICYTLTHTHTHTHTYTYAEFCRRR